MSEAKKKAETKPTEADKVNEGGSGDPGTAGADGSERKSNEPQNGPADTTGPGTGTPAPPESSYRTPSTIVEDSEGAPLDPPSDTPTQVEPAQGHNKSSTDHVYAEAGGRTVAGEDHKRLVDENGRKVSANSLFDDTDGSKTFVIAKKRVFEEFYYPNTTTVARRLLFPAGKRIPRSQAEKIKRAIEDAPEPEAASRV